MTTLRLHFLGPPRIERAGMVVAADTRKATALLAYVALRGEPQTRDALAALLWPEFDSARARAALRRTLSALKTAVGPQALAITRETIGLQPDRAWCDVLHFQELVARDVDRSALETAVNLYRADFLDGFSLRDSIPFDDWQVWQAQRLRQSLERALLQLVDLAVSEGAYAAALPLAQRLLELDPLREETQRILMQLYAWLGRPNAALRTYRACVRILDEELGVSPLPETTALYEAIQQARSEPALSLSPAPLRAPPPTRVAAHPSLLVGRAGALAQMERALSRVGSAVQLLIVAGETGIGKTRLAEHFSDACRAAGAQVLGARCYAGESNLAYAPMIQLLREGVELPGARDRLAALPPAVLAQAARLLPELAPHAVEPAAASEAPGAQSRFFEGVGQVLAALLDGPLPGILWIDDAHWLDAATLAVLLFWMRRPRQRPYLLLLALREDELAANAPLQQALAEMHRAGRAERIHLDRLAPRDVATLLAAARPDHPPDLAERLFDETEGLPYFVVEYLAELAHAPLPGSGAEQAWPMPRSVRDLLHDRLAHVSGAAQQLMQTAAAIGQPFPFDLVQVASGRTEEEALAGLEELIRRAILLETSGLYDFSHEKLRALAYEEMSLARRRLLHRRLAETLAAHTTRAAQPAAAAQIGTHFRLAGSDVRAAAYFHQAGNYARDLYAHRDALAYYELALALDDAHTAVLHEACADLHTRLGEYAAALDRYERSAAQATGRDFGRLEHKLARVYQRLGDWPLAAHKLAQARERYGAELDPAEAAPLAVDASLVAHRLGRKETAAALAEEALTLAGQTADPATLAQAYNLLGILARDEGAGTTAVTHLQHSRSLADTARDIDAQIAARNNLALALAALGDTAPAFAALQEALALCRTSGDRHREAALRSNLADLHHTAGEEEHAQDQLREAAAILAEIGEEHGTWQAEIWKLTEW